MQSKYLVGGVILCATMLLGGCATHTTQGTEAGVDTGSLDTRVTQAVRGVPGIGPDDLTVTTQNGVVMLRGRTRTRSQAQDAIEAARHVPGVEKVDYDIHVDDD